MSRTKAEVRAFLDSQVGKVPIHAGVPDLNGQCVTLTKVLMDFLGVPNPYAARGDAINAGDTYIRQGLGTPGRGWLTICVNRDMGYIGGVHYGHIWIDLLNEANYESNGARALYTTKNTRPVQQAQQFINFDKWIREDDMTIGKEVGYDTLNRLHHQIVGNWDMSKAYWDSIQGRSFSDLILEWTNHPQSNTALKEQEFGEYALKDRWDLQIYSLQDQLKAMGDRPTKEQLAALQAQLDAANDSVKKAQDLLDEKTKADAEADKVGQGFIRWIISKISGGK